MSSELIALQIACFVAAFASGMAGFAFNLIASGILLHWMPPQQTAPLLVLASLIIQLGTIGVVWPTMRWAVLRPYVVAGILGTPIGTLILRHGDARAITVGVGVLLVVYAGWTLSRMALRRSAGLVSAGPTADAGIGFVGGVMGGIGGFSGALPAMWGDLKGLRKDEARAIFQPYIIAMQMAAAIGLLFGGFFTPESSRLLLAALPALVLGAWLGVKAYRLIPADAFRCVLLVLLLLSGVSLMF